MSYAYANKDQMKIYKSAAKPDKDFPERSTNRIMFECKKDTGLGVYISTLTATDGYQLVRRNLSSEAEAHEGKMAIPYEAMEAAEKTMKRGDLAYFDDNKITVRQVIEQADGSETTIIKAEIPFAEQIDLFGDFQSVLEKYANSELPERICTVNAKVLKKVVEQLKAGDASVFVKLHLRASDNGLEPVMFSAFEGVEDEEITAVLMPIKE